MLPDAPQVRRPFHVVGIANERLDEVRLGVQNEILGHRGHPPYRPPLLVMAHEGLTEDAQQRRRGLLAPGDPKGKSPTTGPRTRACS